MNLRVAVNGEYFDDAKAGIKTHEYRLKTPYWTKRLVGRHYDTFTMTKGYPKRGDKERILTMPYRGYEEQTITHKHFGDKPVDVFAIIITPPKESE